ncbi:glycoside hydrolase family 30 protein [Maribacter hydrothermalis]|uniref:Glucosylceramidase n=1 Tax=Maribacter hydrothermalis TaxID=1836467 RepID=A0A1B7Z4B1_9FLAO|nr:glycoside hydrolase family 30 beta sandwich domain-containing protein [Maribacter hydrothermalis]APQ17286.1 glucosylceramidase [Maribacter hydrothermalis]OBR37545.1 glucosylceramidase [Maribacter hydrothermalis]
MKYDHVNFCALLALFFLVANTACSTKDKKTIEENSAEAKLYITTLDKSQLVQEHAVNMDSLLKAEMEVAVDIKTTYQEIDGFGFTLTGGSALHMSQMSASARAALIQELFGKEANAIGVSYLRLSIGGSDLDEYPWSYNDLPKGLTDESLSKFSLAYDTLYLIPVLKEILDVSPNLKLMGSPWSPPSWMKDNQDTRGGSLLPKYQNVYANYLAKYIQEMSKHGITIDALTIQNEPLHPGNNPSLLMLAEQQADFIKNDLGPTFKRLGIKTKIVIYDHNADRPDYPISILNDADAAQYIDGSAFHLYGGKIEALSEVHEAHPTKNIYFTEQWVGAPGNFEGDVAWHNETLIIGATRNWSKTVLEWNLAADENEDPHTDRGGCDRCLGALTITGDSVVRNPGYYIIGQASKFVPPGSRRIASNTYDNLPNVAFITPASEVVVILQNKETVDKTIEIKVNENSVFIEIPAKSIGSLVYKNPSEIKD